MPIAVGRAARAASPSPSPSTPSWVSSSLAATERIAAAVAGQLAPPDVVDVVGELGAGKTAFVRAACAALGVTDRVTSPTFTVGHRYAACRVGRSSHLDLYRSAAAFTVRSGPTSSRTSTVPSRFVEWPEPGAGVLPAPRLVVELRLQEADARLISLAKRTSGTARRDC